jgi:cell fate regulator YaaT (PSP1 superfamily)
VSSHLVEVAFKGNRKDFFLWEGDAPPPVQAPVVVEADRGEDIGLVHAVGELATKRNAGTAHGYGQALPTRRARRLATPEDVARLDELRAQDEDARQRAMERVKANQLVMKVSDAEWQWDRKKLTFYFTADKRVDFRNLVRELAAMFRTRIELKQIGVRDEAKRLDGIGRCGRQYCSSAWLPELRPVNLGVAKDQRLSLNPTQISGACGRLMCCLRYEHEFYVEQRRRFPKEGKILTTSRGEEKVVANDIFRERVTLRGADGESRLLPLEELRREVEEAGGVFPVASGGGAARAPEATADELPMEEGASRAGSGAHGGRSNASSRNGGRPGERHHAPSRPPRDETGRRPAPSEAEPLPTGAAAPGEGAPADRHDEEGEARRPHRRRGRRGGRRNRSGRTPDDGAPPPAPTPE